MSMLYNILKKWIEMEQCSQFTDTSSRHKHIQDLFSSLNGFALLMSSRRSGFPSTKLTLSVTGLLFLVKTRA